MKDFLKIYYSPDNGDGAGGEPTEPKQPEAPEDGGDGEGGEELTLEQKFEQLTAQFEQVKKSQQGSDKKNAELQKENERLKEQYLTAEQKAEEDKQRREQEIEDRERRIREAEIENIVNNYILENSLDKRFKKFIAADTQEEIEGRAKELNSLITDAVKKNDQEWIKKSAKPGDGQDKSKEKKPGQFTPQYSPDNDPILSDLENLRTKTE